MAGLGMGGPPPRRPKIVAGGRLHVVTKHMHNRNPTKRWIITLGNISLLYNNVHKAFSFMGFAPLAFHHGLCLWTLEPTVLYARAACARHVVSFLLNSGSAPHIQHDTVCAADCSSMYWPNCITMKPWNLHLQPLMLGQSDLLAVHLSTYKQTRIQRITVMSPVFVQSSFESI